MELAKLVQQEKLLFTTLIIVSARFLHRKTIKKAVKQEIRGANITSSGDRVDISLRKPFKQLSAE